MTNVPVQRYSAGITEPLLKLQTHHKELIKHQSDAIADSPNRLGLERTRFAMQHLFFEAACRTQKDRLVHLFIEMTKQDLAMNLFVVRAKSLPQAMNLIHSE